LTEDFQVRHPKQIQLTDDPTAPPQQHTGKVSGATATHPIEEGEPPETCFGANSGGLGEPSIRKLSPDSCWLSEQDLVDRFSAGACAHGVTLVNDRIPEFDDGRVTYLGHSGEEAHVVVQWGGPIPTLVRLGAALLSEDAFNQLLTPSRVAPLLSGTTAFETLRLGRQLGWLSDTEQDYDDLRARYEQVSTALFYRLGSRHESTETWSRLCSEAHGLLATATNLYDAAGIDLAIHVRLPDTNQLIRDDARYNRFISFMKNTVPKNAAYRGNSAPRMLLEKDGDKLGYRLPVDINDTDRDAELTANWVITGLNVTSFHDDLVAVFDSVPVRDQVANGDETGIRIPIEIARGNSHSNLRHTVEILLERLDRDVHDSLSISKVTNLYLYAFGNLTHNSLTCSPFDIAEALIAADHLAPTGAPLTTPILARGLGAVSPKKLYPWLPPTARKFMRALFKAEIPLKRSEILEAADISQSSYERHRGGLDDSGLLVEEEPHRYGASFPGQWSSSDRPLLAEDADVQELCLHQKLLEAQVQAHNVVSLQNPDVDLTRVYIG